MTLTKSYLENELGRLPLTVHEYTRFHERGLALQLQWNLRARAAQGPDLAPKVGETARLLAGHVDDDVRWTGGRERRTWLERVAGEARAFDRSAISPAPPLLDVLTA